MRYPPTSAALSTSLSAISTHPVSDVLLGASLGQGSAARSSRPTAVILDLFGTLVTAPSAVERSAAATQFAEVLRVSSAVAESALSGSWRARHDGQLRSTAEVAAHLVARCKAPVSCVNELERLLAQLARDRLQADVTLLQALKELRHGGVRLAVLSDASPDIAEAWSHSGLAPHFDAAVFSCRAGAVKPAPQLFSAALGALGVAPEQVLYCGDGGGDELAGAERAEMRAVRVERRGGPHGLAFGETAWHGRAIPEVEALPSLLSTWRER
ncbi:HAD family hydrolase [Streptomyces kebangsaanensis]|uniref:HAD family hydrolase n=1 Tax=Streptomyces kebangsaanensis TaxID=864058 RepID=A0ABW6KZX6_9ACTN